MMTRSIASRLLRPSLWLAGVLSLLTALVGVAHTRPGRPLLALLVRHSGRARGACPLGYDVARSPQEREAARRRFAVSHRGLLVARARPALGFTLDKTTRADVETWSKSNAVECSRPRGGADLQCVDVPATLLPAAFAGVGLQSLWLTFGSGDTLISLTAVRRDPSVAPISAAFAAMSRNLSQEAGPPSNVEGDATAAALAAGTLHQASVEYRFRDYYALSRATNMGNGFVITEEYRSLPNG